MNSCACISYRSKKRCLQACAYATAICVKLNYIVCIYRIHRTSESADFRLVTIFCDLSF